VYRRLGEHNANAEKPNATAKFLITGAVFSLKMYRNMLEKLV
jgi:hypothetical protein